MNNTTPDVLAPAAARPDAFGLQVDIPALETGIDAGDVVTVLPVAPVFGDLVAVTLADGRTAALLFEGSVLRPEANLFGPVPTRDAAVHGVCVAVSKAIPRGAEAPA